ncbi:5'-methylthioadenosine/S-adenosylhomocysteine nucleosidase [Streptomyces sp. NBRC 109706]|uniref:5'-methylthioadenosine/S-adenosylhomocysteine nucleosidase family protein n=1 Tax=Streptomyces sp. NBRC 109706 TaxID=1550035 RepID=UPI000781BD45|nr:5'-methylthioadenosine/S-adenosylhomocysteine nucleosidase [Streptomyces sp. NBRC 109706]
MSKDPVVILTALNLEYQAMRQRLTGPEVHRHKRGTRFEVGTVQGTSCRIVLGLTNKGNQSAAVIAERAIQEFSPVALLFVGVAGALWETARLGDVVMATHVYAYHGGTSEDDGLKSRPRVWETAHGIQQLGSHLARVDDWAGDLPDRERVPQVRFGAIAAGEVVQNSKISAEARWIRQHYNDALAIEMEAAGVAQAGHLNGAPVAIIRGISDRADGTKSSANDRNWQPQAAANAAAFATRLAVELVAEQEQIAMSQADQPQTGGRTQEHISNTAHNSTIGIMAGSVKESSVFMNAAPQTTSSTGLAADLDGFREHMKRHHLEGALDGDTYQEALVELRFARQAAGENSPETSRKTTMALKRLRGLIADSPELTARLAPMVVAAGNLS